MVRAKFRVVKISRTLFTGNEGVFIELVPVTDGSPENKEFYQYTPSGKIELGTINAEAAAEFKLGKNVYVDFSDAPE